MAIRTAGRVIEPKESRRLLLLLSVPARSRVGRLLFEFELWTVSGLAEVDEVDGDIILDGRCEQGHQPIGCAVLYYSRLVLASGRIYCLPDKLSF